MFAHLPVAYQYLYAALFGCLCGFLTPYLGGFGLGVFSLAVFGGALALKGSSLPERLLTHPVLCFLIPFLLLLVEAVCIVCVMKNNFTPMAAGTPPVSSLGIPEKIAVVVALLVPFIPVYIQFRALHLSGGPLIAAVAAVGVGCGVTFWIWDSALSVKAVLLSFLLASVCQYAVLVCAGRHI